MARGLGRSAETAFAYFGNCVSGMTRIRIFGNLTGNNKAGKASRNTMTHKLMRLFKTETSLIICYDNFQRGLTLQHQRGKHSSAFFNGTHQCAHKMTPFDDTTFDAFHPDFTQTDQDIPSPWGMPAFEIVDQSALGTFFDTFESFNSVVLPDFTGARVRAYNDIRDVTVHLGHLRRAFPNSAENDTSYFGQCPSTFGTQKLHRFGRIMNKKHISNMAANAAAMQEKTVKT